MNTTFTKLTATLALLLAAGSLTAGEKEFARRQMEARLLAAGRHARHVARRRTAGGDENHRRDRSGECGTGPARRGLIEQPEIGSNVYDLRPWEGYQWRYSRSFATPEHADGDRVQLNFNGIDCYADIWVNGLQVGSADNMLIEHPFRRDQGAETRRRREYTGGLHPFVGDRGASIHPSHHQHQFRAGRVGLFAPRTPHLRLGHHAAAGERRTVARRGAGGAETRASA